jgi:16S rRNA G527 N7-methylase RsmG
MPDTPSRIIGGSHRDEAIGRLLERTEAIALQHEDFRRVLDGLNGTLAALRETIIRLDATLEVLRDRAEEHGEKISDYDGVKSRVGACEIELKKWAEIRSQIVKYAILVAALALTGSTVGGALLRSALGLP